MPTLDRENFKAIDDRKTVEVDMGAFPGWEGLTVLLRPMSGTLRAECEREWLALPKGEKLPPLYREKVLARCIVGPDGLPIFDDAESVASMSERSGAAIAHLYDIAAKQNGLNAKAVEDEAKN